MLEVTVTAEAVLKAAGAAPVANEAVPIAAGAVAAGAVPIAAGAVPDEIVFSLSKLFLKLPARWAVLTAARAVALA